MKKNNCFIYILLSFTVGFLFYIIFLKNFTIKLYCKKQVGTKLSSFRQAVIKNGADEKIEENDFVNNYLNKLYQECLNKEKIK